jgi:hypothetical protein
MENQLKINEDVEGEFTVLIECLFENLESESFEFALWRVSLIVQRNLIRELVDIGYTFPLPFR